MQPPRSQGTDLRCVLACVPFQSRVERGERDGGNVALAGPASLVIVPKHPTTLVPVDECILLARTGRGLPAAIADRCDVSLQRTIPRPTVVVLVVVETGGFEVGGRPAAVRHFIMVPPGDGREAGETCFAPGVGVPGRPRILVDLVEAWLRTILRLLPLLLPLRADHSCYKN